MNSKTLTIALLAICPILKIGAEERHLEIPEITIPSGGNADFRIDLVDENESTISIDGEIEFPEGFEVLPLDGKPNDPGYTLNYSRNERMIYDSSYPYRGKGDDNDVRLILQTNDNSEIKGVSGWVVKLPLTTTLQPGTYQARMHKIHIANSSYNEITAPEVTVKITVTEPVEIRYTDNQIFSNDIEINQGENAQLNISYNSTSDVYEYSADIILPSNTSVAGDVKFSETLSTVENFTNTSTLKGANLTLSGIYGGGRRDVPAPSGIQEIASMTLNTASLSAGEYEIKISNQLLSNDDDDYSPEEYVAKLIVNAAPQAEKCDSPVISIEGNQLIVHSDTEGATYHTTIAAHDHQEVTHGENEPIELIGQYLITSYASAPGYANSDPVTVTLVWNKENNIETGADLIDMDKNRMLLIKSEGSNLVISGVRETESIVLCDMTGKILYQGKSDNNTFTIPYLCEKGQLYILKIGTESIKYMF